MLLLLLVYLFSFFNRLLFFKSARLRQRQDTLKDCLRALVGSPTRKIETISFSVTLPRLVRNQTFVYPLVAESHCGLQVTASNGSTRKNGNGWMEKRERAGESRDLFLFPRCLRWHPFLS